MILGKTEIIATNSAQKASFYKDVLSRCKIDYDSKTKSSSSGNIMRTSGNLGRMGESVTSEFTYHIYVKKADVDRAKNAIYEAERNS